MEKQRKAMIAIYGIMQSAIYVDFVSFWRTLAERGQY